MLLTVSLLTTRVQAPDQDVESKLRRLLGYLKVSQDLSLILKPDENFSLIVHIDASHAVHPDMKGHTGAVLSLGRGAQGCHSN
jgi:hypothetical protein